MKKKLQTTSVYLFFLLGVFGLNLAGAAITKINLMPWYQQLIKPGFNPPDWVFGPVWTLLYIIIAWVGAFIWQMPKSSKKHQLLTLWFIQMGLNFMWSFLFFGFHYILLAALELSLLIVVVGVLTQRLYQVFRLGCYGFTLYLAWIVYAGVLNWMLYLLNR